MPNPHFILIFHGSKEAESKESAKKFENILRKSLSADFSLCYLREGRPTLFEALDLAYSNGKRSISCLPLLLLPGSHTKVEIPEIIGSFRQQHQDCSIKQMSCLVENDFFSDFILKTLGAGDGKRQSADCQNKV